MPSFDGFHPVEFSTSSGNEIQKLVNFVLPWRPFFIIDGFPRGYQWFTLFTINQSISLIYSHEMKCIGSMASKTLGYQEIALLSSLLPRCDRSYVYLTLAYTTSQIHSVLGHGYGHRLVADPQCMFGSCTRHESFLSWIHAVFLVAMASLMESIMDMQCIVGN